MYRAHLPNGTIECERYEHVEAGVELYGDDSAFAFVPYENLLAITDTSAEPAVDRSVL